MDFTDDHRDSVTLLDQTASRNISEHQQGLPPDPRTDETFDSITNKSCQIQMSSFDLKGAYRVNTSEENSASPDQAEQLRARLRSSTPKYNKDLPKSPDFNLRTIDIVENADHTPQMPEKPEPEIPEPPKYKIIKTSLHTSETRGIMQNSKSQKHKDGYKHPFYDELGGQTNQSYTMIRDHNTTITRDQTTVNESSKIPMTKAVVDIKYQQAPCATADRKWKLRVKNMKQ